jgi:hypothetical protein
MIGEIQNACTHEFQLPHPNRTVYAALKSNAHDSHCTMLDAGIRPLRIVPSHVTRYCEMTLFDLSSLRALQNVHHPNSILLVCELSLTSARADTLNGHIYCARLVTSSSGAVPMPFPLKLPLVAHCLWSWSRQKNVVSGTPNISIMTGT